MPKDATSRACHPVQDYFPNYPAVGSLPCQQACPGMQPTPDAAGQKGEELKQMLNHIEVSRVKQGRNSGKLRIHKASSSSAASSGRSSTCQLHFYCIYYQLLSSSIIYSTAEWPAPVQSLSGPFSIHGFTSVGLKRSPQSSLAVQPLPPGGAPKRQRPSGHC